MRIMASRPKSLFQLHLHLVGVVLVLIAALDLTSTVPVFPLGLALYD